MRGRRGRTVKCRVRHNFSDDFGYIHAMKHATVAELGELSRRRGIAYYHQVYTLLAKALADGSIAAGTALPSESALMRQFQVSRNTVRRALGRLEAEKRIVKRRGSGSYARSTRTPAVTAEAIAQVVNEVGSAKSGSSSRLLRVQHGPTPEFIRRRDPQFGEASLMVQRCRSYQELPFLLTTSFVPESLGRQLTRRQLTQHTVLMALHDLGIVADSAEQITTAITADAMSARHLGVDTASALLCIHRLIRDAEGHAIEHQSHYFRPDRCHLQASLSLDRSGGDLRWQDAKAAPMAAWL